MRPGPPRGATATFDVAVTPDMAAHAATSPPVAVCGTAALCHLVEQICREVLEPHLESDEEGVGAALELAYRVPVPVGETMNLTATVAVVGPTKLVCEVLVRHAGQNVARGSFEQQVVSSSTLRQEIESRRTVPE
jgi:fluoroacetyl-CoA thioesterase